MRPIAMGRRNSLFSGSEGGAAQPGQQEGRRCDGAGSRADGRGRFSAAGEVTGIYTPARWGRFGGRYAQAAWEGHFADYRETAGMRIPMSGEVGWYSDGAWQCVWKGKLTEVVYRTTG